MHDILFSWLFIADICLGVISLFLIMNFGSELYYDEIIGIRPIKRNIYGINICLVVFIISVILSYPIIKFSNGFIFHLF